MPKIKFKKFTIKWNQFFNYVFLILLSSTVLLVFLIALPLTEKLTNVVAFDLNISDNYWSREYSLDLESEDPSDINKTKNILFKRLNDYGVEEVSIKEEEDLIKIVVKTTRPQTYVDELVRNPYIYSIVTRREDIDFDSEENQYAEYLGENYNDTQFSANSFRNIYVTKLTNSTGEKSYFGIAKPWPNQSSDFNKFLTDYAGEYIGVNIDGFVTPVYIQDQSTVFAIPLSIQEESIDAIDILYNDGNIPGTYEVTDQKDIDVNDFNINYIEVSIAFFISILAIYLYTYLTKLYSKEMILRSLFTTLFSLSLFLSFLKISSVPIHVFILIINAVFLIVLSNLIQQNKESRLSISITSLVIGLIFTFLGIGYLRLLGKDLLIISLISYLGVVVGNFYINKVSNYFKK
jgi:hypothetical protein